MADKNLDEYFASTVAKDFLELFAGDKIGYGSARAVYECRRDASMVIKVEVASKSFQNAKEWEFWVTNQYAKKISEWLAPCIDISPCGIVMLQKRTRPPEEKDFTEHLPNFLSDRKRDNFGMLNGRLVCHDYGNTIVNPSVRKTKVEWW